MATEQRSLTGKVVAITGGGRGIGRAIAQALAREGARVAVGDLDRESAEQTAAALGEQALGLPLDVTDHAGHIVNVSSVAGRSGFPHLATYCATKHGVVGLSEAARQELRGTGVEVSVVMPSVVNTELAIGLAHSRVKAVEPE